MWHLRRVHASTMLYIFRERYIWSLRPISDEELTSQKILIRHKSIASALLALELSSTNDTPHFEKKWHWRKSKKNLWHHSEKISSRYFNYKWPGHTHILFFSIIYFIITLQTLSRESTSTHTEFCRPSPNFRKLHLHLLHRLLPQLIFCETTITFCITDRMCPD